jgi:hypothetical protein
LSLAAVFGSRSAPGKLTQNHRFFWGGEFCNSLFSFGEKFLRSFFAETRFTFKKYSIILNPVAM